MKKIIPDMADIPFSDLEKSYHMPALIRIAIALFGFLWIVLIISVILAILSPEQSDYITITSIYLVANYTTINVAHYVLPSALSKKMERSGEMLRLYIWYFGASYIPTGASLYLLLNQHLIGTLLLLVFHTGVVFMILKTIHKIQVLGEYYDAQIQMVRDGVPF